MIRSGKLDRLVTIERRHDLVNDAGTVTTVWTAICTVRAELISAETIESADQDGTRSAESIAFRLRWPGPVTTAERIRFDGRDLDIRKVRRFGRTRTLEIQCEAR